MKGLTAFVNRGIIPAENNGVIQVFPPESRPFFVDDKTSLRGLSPVVISTDQCPVKRGEGRICR